MTSVNEITYQQTFPTGNYANVKLGIEMSLVPGIDDPLEAFAQARKIVNDAFQSLHPGASPTPSITDYNTGEQGRLDAKVERATTKEEWEDAMIKEIAETTKIDEVNGVKAQIGLLAYSTAANQSEKVKVAYDQRLKELQG